MDQDPKKIDGTNFNKEGCRGCGTMKQVIHDTSKNHKDQCFGNWCCPVTPTSGPRVWEQYGGNGGIAKDDVLPIGDSTGYNKYVCYWYEDAKAARQGCMPWLWCETANRTGCGVNIVENVFQAGIMMLLRRGTGQTRKLAWSSSGQRDVRTCMVLTWYRSMVPKCHAGFVIIFDTLMPTWSMLITTLVQSHQ